MREPKIIVLDCDDVMLDYNHAWGNIYSEFFKYQLQVANHQAYHAAEYWGVDWIGREEEHKAFADHFTIYGWRNMQAIEGAVEATHILHDMGYKILVLTRMPKSGEQDRAANLNDLKFKFDAVIGTGCPPKGNPKKPYVEAIKPVYFVDDMISNFVGIDKSLPTKFVWLEIGREHKDNLKLKKKHTIHHTHPTLHHFVTNVIKP